MTFQEELIQSLASNAGRTAIEAMEGRLSYDDLFDVANKITSFLLKRGIQKETLIGVQLDNRTDIIAFIIGIVNAGGVFVLIDRSLPGSRLSSMIKDLNLTYLISSRRSATLPDGQDSLAPVTYFMEDILPAGRTGMPEVPEYPAYSEDDSLYIYFTSGSTGTPKGIVGSNKSLLQFIKWEIDAFGITKDCRVSQFISPYFDAFLRDVFVPLLTGGTICIPPDAGDFFTDRKMIPWIDERRVTMIHCVPSLFRIINQPSLAVDSFKHLRYILLSGEKIIPSELAPWYKLFGSRIRLVNLYGATETTMIRCFHIIQPEDVRLEKIPIGLPIADTRILIAKEDLTPCEPMVPGEVYIISPYVSKGYLNAPGQTHEKFLRFRQHAATGEIAFKTGDMARMRADGQIVLLGRKDRQVKIRGIRVELDEIENVIVQSTLVSNAVVLKSEDAKGNDLLAAFVVLPSGAAEKAAAIHRIELYLKDHLPTHMIPSNIIGVDAYPLLTNGKINYKKLLSFLEITEIVAPVNEIEARVLAIWQRILGSGTLSTETSFLKAGGNSLTLMSLGGKIYEEFHVRMPLRELFVNHTIKKQAEYIQRTAKDNRLVIPRAVIQKEYRLSSAQQRMYYNFELHREGTAFNLPMAFSIKGNVDRARIERTIRLLIKRHESLRTSFRINNGKLTQQVENEAPFELESIDSEDQDIRLAIRRFIRPFELSKAPLLRGGIVTDRNGSAILVIDIHHIICDGQSQVNLYSDFLSLYYGREPEPLTIQYKDYAEWENDLRETNDYIAHREFWLKQFEGGIPTPDLPAADHAGTEIFHDGGNETFQIQRAVWEPISEVLKARGVTAFSGMFSLFFIYLAKLTGQDDLVACIAASGRIQPELEPLVGMFVKTLPIHFTVNPAISFADFALELHNHLMQANGNQLYDLADIVRELNLRRPGATKGISDVMFVFLNFTGTRSRDTNEEFTIFPFQNNTSKNALTLYAYEEEEGFYLRFEYSSACFTGSDIRILIDRFKSLVEKIAQDPLTPMLYSLDTGSPGVAAVANSISFNF